MRPNPDRPAGFAPGQRERQPKGGEVCRTAASRSASGEPGAAGVTGSRRSARRAGDR